MIKTFRKPTRIDFAGGTLDCWPLYMLIDDCYTINLSVSIFSQVEIQEQSSGIHLEIVDLNYTKEFASLEEFLDSNDPEADLLRIYFKYFCPEKGVRIKTQSESPVGAGLGGSSSMSISLISALSDFCGRSMPTEEQVRLASNLECRVLKKPTGVQDYFPAIEPGLHVIQLNADGPHSTRVAFPKDIFTSQMILVYTGQPHHSGFNNWQVIRSAVEEDSATLKGLEQLRDVALKVRQALLAQKWERLPELFTEETEARLALSPAFSSPRIEELSRLAANHGAEAIKICGAGGGGCVMVWCKPECQADLRQEIEAQGFQVLNAQPVTEI